jgi:hypothetical protein
MEVQLEHVKEKKELKFLIFGLGNPGNKYAKTR